MAASDELLERQDERGALELLLAQRRIFGIAKWIRRVRIGGALTITLLGPVVTTLDVLTDNLVGSLAGIWVVLSLLLSPWESLLIVRAARILEQFECIVFGLPWNQALGQKVAPEHISDRLGGFEKAIKRHKLQGWYEIRPGLPGPMAVLLAQRIACVYSQRIHTVYYIVTAMLGAISLSAILLIAVLKGMSLGDFLAGIALPIIPGVIALNEVIRGNATAARQRQVLGDALDEQAQSRAVTETRLRTNQDAQYQIRSSAPPLPEPIYKLVYGWNERAMKYSSARFLENISGERA
ncbi:hypothetical protein J7I89_21230 [Arthrobacter sp. ISL-5]|nr:hypothetical protein [Arthrobacter sp. ISL-5]